MRKLFQPLLQRRPVVNAVVFHAHQVDVRSGAEQTFLQILAKSIVDGERNDQRGDAGGNSQHGDGGDDSDDRLAALGAKIAGGDEKLKAHV